MAKEIKLLLIDDDEEEYLIVKNVISHIKQHTYNLEWEGNYDEAIKKIFNNNYDLILLDYNLGAHSGHDLMNEIFSKGIKIPIVVLTGQNDYATELALMRDGASDYIQKDKLEPQLLERIIRYCLARKRSDEQILHLAYYDQLTGLPNRKLFTDRVQQAVGSAKRYKRIVTLFFIDLDNFKIINDKFGHPTGDHFLKIVSERLLSCIRKCDTIGRNSMDSLVDVVARLGGDEFTVLLTEVTQAEDSTLIANRIIECLKNKFTLKGQDIYTSASIGIAVFPYDGNNVEELLKNADIAMYAVKNSGKNNYQYYQKFTKDKLSDNYNMELSLHKAVDNQTLQLYYKPQFDLLSGKIIAIETSLHWFYSEKSCLMPEKFMPIAEKIGLASMIDSFVINQVCRQYKLWHKMGLVINQLSVNFSSKFYQNDNISKLKSILSKYKIPKDTVVVELNENVLANADNIGQTIKTLKDLDIKICLNDFGSYKISFADILNNLLDILKINYPFIESLDKTPKNQSAAEAIILLARSLNIPVIITCLENKKQLEILQKKEYDFIGGFSLNTSLTTEQTTDILKKELKGQGIGKKYIR